jgi:membrane-bound inhibitor of C-type lysozyme
VSSTSASGFTVTTAGGVKAAIKETSSTSYENTTSPALASAVTTGQSVLVLGTTDNTTITATQVIVQPPAGNSATASQVIFYQKGTSGSTKKVGQIPANYVQGQGTIVSGTEADQATEAALAAYPGGIVDRVVKLGNGDYEVHNIGVNWPHHVFVNQDFKVIGAND